MNDLPLIINYGNFQIYTTVGENLYNEPLYTRYLDPVIINLWSTVFTHILTHFLPFQIR